MQLRTVCPIVWSMTEQTQSLGSFREIIEWWGSREAMAGAIGAKASTVSKWWQRNNIPPDWWRVLLATSVAKDRGLRADVMVRLAAREREVA